MGLIGEGEALLKIVPQIEKIISDAKAAEQVPQVAALIADLETLVSEVKEMIPAAGPAVVPPVAPQ